MVEERGGVVQDVAVELAERDDELQRVAERVVDSNQVGGEEGERSPEGLSWISLGAKDQSTSAEARHTAVTVSMHKTNASWVR